MRNVVRVLVVVSGACLGMVGCGGGDSTIKLVPASGIVTFNGAPLAGAQVKVFPEKGPLAMAETDVNGAFKLKSGALAGCAVGEAKVVVSVPSEDDVKITPPTVQKTPEDAMKMAQMTIDYQNAQANKKSKSPIPEKYKEIATSGLTCTIAPSGSKDLKIELKD